MSPAAEAKDGALLFRKVAERGMDGNAGSGAYVRNPAKGNSSFQGFSVLKGLTKTASDANF